MKNMEELYTNNAKNMDIMLPIINGESRISLRLLDWFVTNYSKTNKVCYLLPDDKKFNVSMDYKAQLKAHNKKFFDPFCRRNRVSFKYNDQNAIVTTIGQLNFFAWAIENNVIDFVYNNIEDIETDMINSNKKKDSYTKVIDIDEQKIKVTAVNVSDNNCKKILLSFE